jgi:hypothetical protein
MSRQLWGRRQAILNVRGVNKRGCAMVGEPGCRRAMYFLLNFAYYSDSPIGAATVRERSRRGMSVTVLCEPL